MKTPCGISIGLKTLGTPYSTMYLSMIKSRGELKSKDQSKPQRLQVLQPSLDNLTDKAANAPRLFPNRDVVFDAAPSRFEHSHSRSLKRCCCWSLTLRCGRNFIDDNSRLARTARSGDRLSMIGSDELEGTKSQPSPCSVLVPYSYSIQLIGRRYLGRLRGVFIIPYAIG